MEREPDPVPSSTQVYGPRLQDWYDEMRHELMIDPPREYDVVIDEEVDE